MEYRRGPLIKDPIFGLGHLRQHTTTRRKKPRRGFTMTMFGKYFRQSNKRFLTRGKNPKIPSHLGYYNKEQRVGSKTMAEHLRFSIAYWHSFMGNGSDMFGGPSFERAWRRSSDPMDRGQGHVWKPRSSSSKSLVSITIASMTGTSPLKAIRSRSLSRICTRWSELAKGLQKETGVKLLWGTANLFGSPMYSQGAGTSPNAHVMAHAAAQVKNAIDATKELAGENYVFWGGREGYETLLNTDLNANRNRWQDFCIWPSTTSARLVSRDSSSSSRNQPSRQNINTIPTLQRPCTSLRNTISSTISSLISKRTTCNACRIRFNTSWLLLRLRANWGALTPIAEITCLAGYRSISDGCLLDNPCHDDYPQPKRFGQRGT